MENNIKYNKEIRQKFVNGVEKLANTVKITLSPQGRNVLIEKQYGKPLITNDGVTIAKEVKLEDRFENMACQIIKEASIRTNLEAGDGTTTAIIISESMLKDGVRLIDEEGCNPLVIRAEMQEAKDFAIETLKEFSTKISDTEDIKKIATISSGGDEKIGNIFKSAYEAVGNDGVIIVEESKEQDHKLLITDGMKINRGLIHPAFAIDYRKVEAELINPKIIIVEDIIKDFRQIAKLLDNYSKQNNTDIPTDVLILAEGFTDETITILLKNKEENGLNFIPVKLDGFKENKKEIADDIAVMCDCKVARKSDGDMFLNDFSYIGEAAKVVVKMYQTFIIDGKGFGSEQIEKRKEGLRNILKESKSDLDKDEIEERLANLNGKVAVIFAGAKSEIEMKEQKLRIDDALEATKSAVEEGYVIGGGITLFKISKAIERKFESFTPTSGYYVVANSLKRNLYQILENCSLSEKEIDMQIKLTNIENNLENGNITFGFNAKTLERSDLLLDGVIDPTKVIRVTIENATSIVSTLLTSECAICLKVNEKGEVL